MRMMLWGRGGISSLLVAARGTTGGRHVLPPRLTNMSHNTAPTPCLT